MRNIFIIYNLHVFLDNIYNLHVVKLYKVIGILVVKIRSVDLEQNEYGLFVIKDSRMNIV